MRRDNSRNRKGELLAFVVVIGLGAMVALYLTQKPKVIEHTVVVAPPSPPAPVVVSAPATQPEVLPPPPPKPQPVVVAPPPPPPACIAIQAGLDDARAAVTRAQTDLDAARSAAALNFQKSDDYLNAKSDLADKQKARDAAADQLAKDKELGADTDHDIEAIQTAAKNLIDAKAALTTLEAGAASSDQNVVDKQTALNSAAAQVAALKRKLSGYLNATIASDCRFDKCKITLAAIDADSQTVFVQLTPEDQTNPGATADAAMDTTGQVLEKVLYKSGLQWKSARFTIYVNWQKKLVPELQLTYQQSDVDSADFKKIDPGHFDNDALASLASATWLSRKSNDIQGIAAPPPAMQAATSFGSRPTMKYTYSLLMGGYTRADGTSCPVSYIRQSYIEDLPILPAPRIN